MKRKKYSTTKYVKEDRALKAMADSYLKKILARQNKLAARYIRDNSPVRVGKVYEIVGNAIKHRGYDRFVIFQQKVQFFTNHPVIIVSGWWINKLTNLAEKWDSGMIVLGVGNPAILKLSENQKYINPRNSSPVKS